MKKILVATDGSNHAGKALRFACDIASKNGAVVYLIHVVSFCSWTSLPGWSDGTAEVEAFIHWMKKDGEKIIEEAEKEAKVKGGYCDGFCVENPLQG